MSLRLLISRLVTMHRYFLFKTYELATTQANDKYLLDVCSFCQKRHVSFIPQNQRFSRLKYQDRWKKEHCVKLKSTVNDAPKTSKTYAIDVGAVFSQPQQPTCWTKSFIAPEPQLDWDYLGNPNHQALIRANIANRKGVGDIGKVLELWNAYQKVMTQEEKFNIWKDLLSQGLLIPNTTHPESPLGDESKARLVEIQGQKREFDFKPKSVVELGENLQILRTENVSMATGPRTYYLLGELARLEQALVRFAVSKLKQKGFQFVSVPDLLHPDIIEGCGFKTRGERTQVYRLAEDKHDQACLAGTAEMSLAGDTRT